MKNHAFPLNLLFALVVMMSLAWSQLGTAASPSQAAGDEIDDGGLVYLGESVINPYFTVEDYALADGTGLEKTIINGPPKPPPGFEAERAASIVTHLERSTLVDFPAFDWVFGCSAVAGAMIAGYYDRNGYANMYSGPTNGGVMPLSDSGWPKWSDTSGTTYPNNPLVASKSGVDGRAGGGSIDNYWVSYLSTAPDPYITNGWPQHTWGCAIGDFMKTSQSAWPYESKDGSTWFWNYSGASKLTCTAMEMLVAPGKAFTIAQNDGTYGRKEFYEARGYVVTDCYNQKTDNQVSGGFSLADFRAEIDAGHPVLLNLLGHSMVGFGYSGATIYIRDTWSSDPNTVYSMPWGGSYHGMALNSVSIVRLGPPVISVPDAPLDVFATDGAYTDRVRISWTEWDDATHYQVFRHTSAEPCSAMSLVEDQTGSPFADLSAEPDSSYHYWVKACNASGCSPYSEPDTGYSVSELNVPSPLTEISTSDGAFSDRVRVAWTAVTGAAFYQVFSHTADDFPDAVLLVDDHLASPFDDYQAIPGEVYTYWVLGCNASGCSEAIISASGWRQVLYDYYLPLAAWR